MIVRIMGEGQFRVDDTVTAELQALDADVEAAVEKDDQKALAAALGALLDKARSYGTPLPPDTLEPSDVIIPPQDATVAEVRKLLTDEGLIPG
ncbi:MAG TPA: hypothetical protein VGS62_05345 [Streptosporangiaceae bacterium]|nr:hypothetical protein [Streptosporangiaceae bacterium]